MRYTAFARHSGLRVSEFALGTANFGAPETGAKPDASQEIFDAFVSAGGTTFDSSDIYQGGNAETVLGRLLGSERDNYVVVTKYSGTRAAHPPPGTTGNSRKRFFTEHRGRNRKGTWASGPRVATSTIHPRPHSADPDRRTTHPGASVFVPRCTRPRAEHRGTTSGSTPPAHLTWELRTKVPQPHWLADSTVTAARSTGPPFP